MFTMFRHNPIQLATTHDTKPVSSGAMRAFTHTLIVVNFDFAWRWRTRHQRAYILNQSAKWLKYHAVVLINCTNIPSSIFNATTVYAAIGLYDTKILPALINRTTVTLCGVNITTVARLLSKLGTRLECHTESIRDSFNTNAVVLKAITGLQRSKK